MINNMSGSENVEHYIERDNFRNAVKYFIVQCFESFCHFASNRFLSNRCYATIFQNFKTVTDDSACE